MNTEHGRQRIRRPAVLAFGVVSGHLLLQLLPRNQLVHALQKNLTASFALLGLVLCFGEGDLIHGSNESYRFCDGRIIADFGELFRPSLVYLMTEDQEFIDSIELSTSSVQAVTVRFDKWRLSLQSILGINQKEPRCFSFKLKEDMMASDPTCAICQQRIQSADDAALDHIKQYWVGGKTVPENARLTHRYCNWARSRSDTGVV